MNFEKPQSLPRYTDDEVAAFHPILGYCLSEAINNLSTSPKFIVEHHKNIGSLTADFAIINSASKRILLPIEVKRTPASISSTRYRNQARMYVTEAGKLRETPFYALTNLEITELYRYDPKRASVIEQVIEPGAINIGFFKSTRLDDFLQKLIKLWTEILLIILVKGYSYKDQIKNFSSLLNLRKNNLWHESLMPTCFEYIRGAVKNIKSPADSWHPATFFKSNPQRMLEMGEGFNFKSIFKTPPPSSTDKDIWDPNLIKELYNAGLIKQSGDDIAEFIHLIVGKGREAEGIVTTDTELARFLIALTRIVLNRDLQKNEIVCDPAAGIGSLLTSLIDFYPTLEPRQIWANDKEHLFEEGLSLRLGLLFATMLSNTNSPVVTISCISKLKPEQFDNVKVIVMNPPFISTARGLNVNEQKSNFSKRIKDITGHNSVLNIGQIGVEGLFLELVTSLVKKGTLMALIIPKRYLTAQGDEAVAFRKFLVNEFGMNILATYPREGLFEDVTKATMIVVGIKGDLSTVVQGISTNVSIDHIDLQEMVNKLSDNREADNFEPVFGVFQRAFERKKMTQFVEQGWRSFFGAAKVANEWVESNFKGLVTLKDIKLPIKRGRLGNKGLSDLLFISSNKKLWDICKDKVPSSWLSLGIKNSDQTQNPFLDKKGDLYHFLKIPDNIAQERAKSRSILNNIIKCHSKLGHIKGTKQKKKEKTIKETLKILEESAKLVSRSGTVLIPRNIRRLASGFVLTKGTYVSTNFVEVSLPNKESSLLFLSWILSIFGQLQFELFAQDQEGARKIEKKQVEHIKIPDLTVISDDHKKKIINTMSTVEFLDFYNMKVRTIDLLWGQALFGSLGPEKVNEAKGLLEELILERDPQ